jgi:DNA repair ATPase RecN
MLQPIPENDQEWDQACAGTSSYHYPALSSVPIQQGQTVPARVPQQMDKIYEMLTSHVKEFKEFKDNWESVKGLISTLQTVVELLEKVHEELDKVQKELQRISPELQRIGPRLEYVEQLAPWAGKVYEAVAEIANSQGRPELDVGTAASLEEFNRSIDR